MADEPKKEGKVPRLDQLLAKKPTTEDLRKLRERALQPTLQGTPEERVQQIKASQQAKADQIKAQIQTGEEAREKKHGVERERMLAHIAEEIKAEKEEAQEEETPKE